MTKDCLQGSREQGCPPSHQSSWSAWDVVCRWILNWGQNFSLRWTTSLILYLYNLYFETFKKMKGRVSGQPQIYHFCIFRFQLKFQSGLEEEVPLLVHFWQLQLKIKTYCWGELQVQSFWSAPGILPTQARLMAATNNKILLLLHIFLLQICSLSNMLFVKYAFCQICSSTWWKMNCVMPTQLTGWNGFSVFLCLLFVLFCLFFVVSLSFVCFSPFFLSFPPDGRWLLRFQSSWLVGTCLQEGRSHPVDLIRAISHGWKTTLWGKIWNTISISSLLRWVWSEQINITCQWVEYTSDQLRAIGLVNNWAVVGHHLLIVLIVLNLITDVLLQTKVTCFGSQ